MTVLIPCQSCNRHVRSGEACPFCGATSDETSASPLARTSRAALFAIATAACGHAQMDVYGGPPAPLADAAPSATAAPPAAPVTAYGGPPQPTVAPPQPAPKQ